MIDTGNPDLVIGTETLLSPDILNGEIFSSGYTPYHVDRNTGAQCGGVLIPVGDSIISSEQPQLQMKCEVILVKLEITGSCPLFISAYYKPKEDD